MKGKQTISNQQIKNLIVTTAIGVGILSLPSQMATILDNDGWIPILIGGLLFIPILIMIDRLYKMYPNRTIVEIGMEIYGRLFFSVFMIIILVYLVMFEAYALRVFGEVVKSYLLEITPIEVIVLTLLLAVSYLARSELTVVARTANMVYPILLGLIIFLIVLSIPNSDPTNMLPAFQSDLKNIPKGIMASLFPFAGYEIIFIAYPYSEDTDNRLKYVIRGLLIVTVIYVIVFVICLSLFGIDQLKREIWPTMALANEVDFGGYYVENVEGIVLALWSFVVYSTSGPILFFAGRILSKIFNTKSHDLFIFLLIPIVYVIAILPENVIVVYNQFGEILNYLTLVSIVIMPIVFVVGAWIKKRRSKA
jgi:spore germination protein